MARKTLTYAVATPGRDQNKTFLLTEMSAFAAERWAMRAFLALARSGVDIPEEIETAGMAGLALVGVRAFAGVAYDDLAPLLDEMMTCVQMVPDPARPQVVRPLFGEDDVEEVATLLELRREVFGLHVDFSAVAALWKSRVATVTEENTPDIPTSPPSSV